MQQVEIQQPSTFFWLVSPQQPKAYLAETVDTLIMTVFNCCVHVEYKGAFFINYSMIKTQPNNASGFILYEKNSQ